MLHLLPLLVDELFLLAPDLLRPLKRLEELAVVNLEALVLLMQLVGLSQMKLVPLELQLQVPISLLQERNS